MDNQVEGGSIMKLLSLAERPAALLCAAFCFLSQMVTKTTEKTKTNLSVAVSSDNFIKIHRIDKPRCSKIIIISERQTMVTICR